MLAAGAREESKKDATENVWIPQDSKLSNTDFQEEMFYPFSYLRDCALFMALIRFLDSGVQFCHVFALDYGFWFRALWIPCSWYIRVQQRISNYIVTFVVYNLFLFNCLAYIFGGSCCGNSTLGCVEKQSTLLCGGLGSLYVPWGRYSVLWWAHLVFTFMISTVNFIRLVEQMIYAKRSGWLKISGHMMEGHSLFNKMDSKYNSQNKS